MKLKIFWLKRNAENEHSMFLQVRESQILLSGSFLIRAMKVQKDLASLLNQLTGVPVLILLPHRA